MRALSPVGRLSIAVALAAVLPAAVAAQAGAPVTRLSLAEAVRMAVARNQALQAQRMAVDAARADEITAALKPNIGVSFSADGLTPFSPRHITWDFLKNSATYGGSASYLFERGGKRSNRIAVAADDHRGHGQRRARGRASAPLRNRAGVRERAVCQVHAGSSPSRT